MRRGGARLRSLRVSLVRVPIRFRRHVYRDAERLVVLVFDLLRPVVTEIGYRLFMSFYADDCVVADLNGAVTNSGAAAIRERYAAMFAKFPQNKAVLVNRIVVGDTVVDHEDVSREPGGERFQVAAIYTIKGGKIARVDFAR